MKTKYKPRSMYATEQFFTKPGIAEKLLRDPGMQFYHIVPVMVLPATPAAYAAQVEVMAKAGAGTSHKYWRLLSEVTQEAYRRHAQVLLAAIGINRPKRNPATGTGAQGKGEK